MGSGGSSRVISHKRARRLGNNHERIRSWRGTGRALIDLARKLLGITCHTLKTR